jgi:hypothetical protein
VLAIIRHHGRAQYINPPQGRALGCLVNCDKGLDKVLGHKTDHAKAQAEKNDEGAKFSSLRFPR